jgi:cytochrome c553
VNFKSTKQFLTAIGLGLGLCSSVAQDASQVFEDEIRPLFKTHCYRCHGATQQKAGLRLDLGYAPSPWAGDSGPVWTKSNSDDSLLIQLLRGTHDSIEAMPYNQKPLPEADIQKVVAWIDEGAIIPEGLTEDAQEHWAFAKPIKPELPTIKQTSWPRNSIDFFVLARLEEQGLSPSDTAPPGTLLRRLFLDLTGLPPTRKDLSAVGEHLSMEDYEDWVEDLLSSPHFGERWGRHWLDVARYADSNGYSIDGSRSMWRYRDWVIDATNANMPFDQFTIEQIAGDLLPHATMQQVIATGFHRNTQINQEGGIDPEQFRMESIFDRMATTGAAWLGLTTGCAQCHDHKFDPMTQEEYYQMFAFFNNQDEPSIPAPTHEESMRLIAWDKQYKPLQAELDLLNKELPDKVWQWEKFFDEKDTESAPEEIKTILGKLPTDRSKEDEQKLIDHFKKNQPDYVELSKKVEQLRRRRPRTTTAMVLKERTEERPTHMLIKGDFTRPADQVRPGVPASLHPLEAEGEPNRLDLANWLVSSENPLTARVVINRVWQKYFGTGIVETENDFGTQGTLPSHPQLLDWLACEFMDSGWDMKHMHRLIVNSATYRQSSKVRKDLNEKDTRNLFLGRQNRLRLDSEIVRDVALHASGLLQQDIGGPSAYPPQPDGVMGLGQVQRSWKADEGDDRYRRGMYTFFWRATPHPALAVFDSPDAFSTCTRRIRSNTPLQALTLLNDPAFYEMATHFADLIQEKGGNDDATRIRFGFERCTARQPSSDEFQQLLLFIKDQRQLAESDDSVNQDKQVWLNVARVLLNLDETITRE